MIIPYLGSILLLPRLLFRHPVQDRAGRNHAKIALRPEPNNSNALRWTLLEPLENSPINDPGSVRFQLPPQFTLTRVE